MPKKKSNATDVKKAEDRRLVQLYGACKGSEKPIVALTGLEAERLGYGPRSEERQKLYKKLHGLFTGRLKPNKETFEWTKRTHLP